MTPAHVQAHTHSPYSLNLSIMHSICACRKLGCYNGAHMPLYLNWSIFCLRINYIQQNNNLYKST